MTGRPVQQITHAIEALDRVVDALAPLDLHGSQTTERGVLESLYRKAVHLRMECLTLRAVLPPDPPRRGDSQ